MPSPTVIRDRSTPLFDAGVSSNCERRHPPALLLHDVIRSEQECGWEGQPKRRCRLEIDSEIEPRRLHRGQVPGLRAFEDPIDVSSRLAEAIVVAWAIRHESAVPNDEV